MSAASIKFAAVLFTAPPPFAGGEASSAAVKVDGRESVLRAVDLFLNRDAIERVVLCFSPEFAEEGKRKFGGHLSFAGVKVATGGPKWVDQLAAAAEKLPEDATHVIVHDAARPAVPYDDIDALLDSAAKHDLTCLATNQRNALFEIDDGGNPVSVTPPGKFLQMLTPMCFKRSRFATLANDRKEPHASEFSLVKASGLNVRVAGGHDAGLLKAMINLLPKPKVKPPSSPFEEAQW
jgi:2-C-methyl-D-erythritol 4-phosphate cytidylyltransferase